MDRSRCMWLRYCFLISFLLAGCGSSSQKEDAILLASVAETIAQSEEIIETTEEVALENGEKIIWEDLDGNGVQEYLVISNEESGRISLYFNEDLIYQYEDKDLRIVGIWDKQYIDLNQDGENEIFVSFLPNVNSMPLMKWFALQKGDDGWETMEMFCQKDEAAQNAFPISVALKAKEFELSITCEGCDKELIFDATKHYEKKKADKEEWKDSSYDDFVGSNFQVGDIVGSTSAWGIWNIESGTYEGQNCLIAEHGLNGPNGKYDFYGYLDVYFCYDEDAKIRILDIVFREVAEE